MASSKLKVRWKLETETQKMGKNDTRQNTKQNWMCLKFEVEGKIETMNKENMEE